MKSTISFDEFKLNSDGMIPVITQDYKTNEVLMLAYMTKESFEKTLETGKMTYFSRKALIYDESASPPLTFSYILSYKYLLLPLECGAVFLSLMLSP